MKRGGSFKSKKKRWFVLSDEVLTYFADDTESKPLGSIPLSEISKCEVIGNKDICVRTPYRDYEITADSLAEGVEWIEEIEERIKKSKEYKELVAKGIPVTPSSGTMKIKRVFIARAETEELRVMYEQERRTNEEIIAENRQLSRMTQDLNNVIERKDQEISVLTNLLEQKNFLIKNLEDELSVAKAEQIEFTKGSVNDQEIVKKWEIDVERLKKIKSEQATNTEELAYSKAQLKVANKTIEKLREKLKSISDIIHG